jgi:nicotinate-nucleotide adenylyltransferase
LSGTTLTSSRSGARHQRRHALGLLGGTFNPPHIGHLILAQEALLAFGLDRVLLVPAGVPPHKEVDGDPGPEERVAMCEAAVAGDERLGVSRADVDRAGPAYTVELLRALRAAAPEDDFVFVVGGDMAHSLPTWREPGEVLALARLAVAEREGVARQEIMERLGGLRGAQERVDFFAMPRIDISSSLIRRRAAAGLPVRYLVPDAVAGHIARRGLYGAAYPEGSA